MYYNTDMWAAAGLTEADIPTTWDEFREVAKKLTIRDENGNLVQAGFSYNGGIQGDVLGMKYQYGQNLFNEDGTASINNEAMKNVITRLHDMYVVDGVCDYSFGNNSGCLLYTSLRCIRRFRRIAGKLLILLAGLHKLLLQIL